MPEHPPAQYKPNETAHIPYNLCTVFNKLKTFKILEHNFIKQTSHLTPTKLAIAIHRTVQTKFSPHNNATYGKLLQRKPNVSYCTMKCGTFLFSKNFWTRWVPPSSRGTKLDPQPWSTEVQNTKNPTTTPPPVPLFSTQGQTDLVATHSVITADIQVYSKHRDLRAYVMYIKHTYLVASKTSRNSPV
jgi:hypothetical protein